MKLVIFDLDGTLARTSAVDETCFVQAFLDVLNVRRLSTKWLDYDQATDSAVAREVFTTRRGRELEASDLSPVIDRFVELLQRHHSRNASEFSEVSGAKAMLHNLRQGSTWGIALATGGWKRSAEFKIQKTGLPLDDIPAAFANDGPSREQIVQTAIARASAWYEQREFERIVSVGDAAWNIQTARTLNLPFVGVADEQGATRLRGKGARHVIGNFLDQPQFLRWLDEAIVP